MDRSHDGERFPDDIQEVADQLRQARPGFTPNRARPGQAARNERSTPVRPQGKRSFLRSRPAMSLLTVAFLAIGTGGALAGAGTTTAARTTGVAPAITSTAAHTDTNSAAASVSRFTPPPPKCKSGYEHKGGKCVPCPPPPKCESGYERSGNNCIKIPPPPPPPPKCKSGYVLSGYNCIKLPPPPPPPPKCKSRYQWSGEKCTKNQSWHHSHHQSSHHSYHD